MSSKLRKSLKKVPVVVPVYQFLRSRFRLASSLIRRAVTRRSYPRSYFESTFTSKQDPWNYASLHQQERLNTLLEQVPAGAGLVLEAGCAEGAFTALLAKRATGVIAADISASALHRARARCASCANVSFVQADLLHLPFSSVFDVIVCAGVLSYFPEPVLFHQVCEQLERLLIRGGHLVFEDRWETGDGSRSGKSTYDHLASSPLLKCGSLQRKDEYGIAVFERIN